MNRKGRTKFGLKGVREHKGRTGYDAVITLNKRQIYLGHYATPQDAHMAYVAAAQKLHGEFWRV